MKKFGLFLIQADTWKSQVASSDCGSIKPSKLLRSLVMAQTEARKELKNRMSSDA